MSICKNCGTEFPSKTSKQYCSNECKKEFTHTTIYCAYCNSPKETRKNHPVKYCSLKCSRLDKNYVKEHEKRKRTVRAKYGVDHVLHVPKFQKKQETTNLDKYGNKNPAKASCVKEKIRNSRKDRDYNRLLKIYKGKVDPLFSFEDFKNGDRTSLYSFKCLECKNIFEDYVKDGLFPRCTTCHPKIFNGTSQFEQEIISFIEKELGCNVKTHDTKIISPYELDIIIPDHKLAIEANGIYWHSELAGRNRAYHNDKTDMCENSGYDLVHVFENEWTYKTDIVKSILRSRLNKIPNRIYARKCDIQQISHSQEQEFLMNNHIQGLIASKICYGLYYRGELVSIMSFGKSRYERDYEWEILRMANKINTTVIGGFNRLIRHFKKIHRPNSIVTYSDRRYFTGDIYHNMGFKFLGITPPNYYYFSRGSLLLESRQKYQKHVLKDKLGVFDDKMTEWENMQLNGYNRIWDCGNKKFGWSVL